jgi:frataxin-like iron-binding protein CyaY
MKFTLALCLLVALAYSAVSERHPVDTHLDQLKEKFPKEEWQTFWNKLTDSLGDERTNFMEKLEQNQGNMQMTLAEFRDKMEGDYPVIVEYYSRVQGKWEELNRKLNTMTVSDVINFLIEKVHKTFGDMKTGNPDQWYDSVRGFLITFYNRLQTETTGRHTRHHRREIESHLNNLEQKFPKTEWNQFWTKLTDALGDQKGEFLQKLEANEGNMQLTLAEFRDKLQDDYPAISSSYETVQMKVDQLTNTLKTTKIADVVAWVRTKLQHTFGDVNVGDSSQMWDSVRAYLITFYNQLNAGHSARRHRRTVEHVNNALDEVEQKFPKQEWDAFWNKLTSTLGDKREEFQTRLESNQGNMDLTLTEFQDKLHGDYPTLKQNWDTVQGKWREVDEKLKTLTLSDIVNWFREKISTAEGHVDNVNVDDWWAKLRAFIVTYYNKVSTDIQQAGQGQYW